MAERPKGLVVTLDGPAGAGKTSTAKEVAHRLGLRHLDSGALYRALTYALLENGVPEAQWDEFGVEELRELGVGLTPSDTGFSVSIGGKPVDQELRSPEVTSRVSLLAKVPAVRECLLELQRGAAEKGGLVADGRDMGTVVFPDAQLKVFLVADLEERARRRLKQEGNAAEASEALVREVRAIADRDEQDSGRDVSPLRRPPGSVEIDTTAMAFDEQVDTIVELAGRLTG